MADGQRAHAVWVRTAHALATLSVCTLIVSGVAILMAHPRLYWGDAGNDLTPALIELPISRNYQHGGWDAADAVLRRRPPARSARTAPTTSSTRTAGAAACTSWRRGVWSLPGAVYLLAGLLGGHFRAHLVAARARARAASRLARRRRPSAAAGFPAASGGPHYGLLQKFAYSLVVFVAAPLMVLTGLTMSPAVTAAFPFLLGCSADTSRRARSTSSRSSRSCCS